MQGSCSIGKESPGAPGLDFETWESTYPNLPATAVLQLLYTEATAAEWLFLKKKPPCTSPVSARSLENRSKTGSSAMR
jgi:hypothetical protein